jgi:predicted protein tyrosine phosphatase
MPVTLHDTDIDLTICGMHELCEHEGRRVSHVLSILDPGWPDPPDFGHYDPHHRLTLRFHDIIEEVPGMEAPQRAHIQALLDYGAELAAGGRPLRHLLIHCHAGVSRSSTAMATLLLQKSPGEEAAVFERLRSIRPQAWPNSRMIRFADELLGCGGRFEAALQEHYRLQKIERPDLVAAIARFGRQAEIPA